MLAAIVCPGSCGWADEVLRLDLRNGCESKHSYFVVLVARRCSTRGPGHTFVGWSELDESGDTVSATACGYYPQVATALGCLIPRKGRIVDESTRCDSLDPAMWTQRLVVQVSRDAYLASLRRKECWAHSKKHFNILRHNCAHFTHDVACAVGLQLPKPLTAEHPPDYLSRLMRIVRCRVCQE